MDPEWTFWESVLKPVRKKKGDFKAEWGRSYEAMVPGVGKETVTPERAFKRIRECWRRTQFCTISITWRQLIQGRLVDLWSCSLTQVIMGGAVSFVNGWNHMGRRR